MAPNTGSTTSGPTASPQEVIRQMNLRIQQLETALANHNPGSGGALKVNKPTPYKGERGKLRIFLIQIDLYFLANIGKIGNETDKVLAASIFLEGTTID